MDYTFIIFLFIYLFVFLLDLDIVVARILLFLNASSCVVQKKKKQSHGVEQHLGE